MRSRIVDKGLVKFAELFALPERPPWEDSLEVLPQTRTACPPVVDNSACEVHQWKHVRALTDGGHITDPVTFCDRCGEEYA